MNTVLPIAYWPPLTYFLLLNAGWKIDSKEHYQKRTLRNRCYLFDSKVAQRLTIPLVKGKHNQMPIDAVRISYDTNWVHDHCKSIINQYRTSPYFIYYYEEIESCILNNCETLWDFNISILNWVMQKFFSGTKIGIQEEYEGSSFDALEQRFYSPVLQHLPYQSNADVWKVSILDTIMHLGPEIGYFDDNKLRI